MGANEAVVALGPLPLSALTWLVVILLPISTMFSALALAVAALAPQQQRRAVLFDAAPFSRLAACHAADDPRYFPVHGQ